MTEQTKNAIKSIIESWIHENGNMPLRLLKSVLRSNNIPESLLENIQPKLWITNEFPEFTVVGTNGYEHVDNTHFIYKIWCKNKFFLLDHKNIFYFFSRLAITFFF